MEIHVLASGSSGNCYFLKTDSTNLLVDAGISLMKIKSALALRKLSISDIDSILITHEHSDHVSGLSALLKEIAVKVYMTKGTFAVINKNFKEKITNEVVYIKADEHFKINDIEIIPFMLSHDAKEPVGFVIEENHKRLVFLTDTGYVDNSYFGLLEDADLYVLESNHEPDLVMKSSRPFPLKKRILGDEGHLSNEDSAWLVNRLVKTKKAIWIVAHISEQCNTILNIEMAIVKYLEDPFKVDIYYALKSGLEKIVI